MLHPLEFARERLEEVRRFSHLATELCPSLTAVEIKTLENRLFCSSRLTAVLAESRVLGERRGQAKNLFSLLVAGCLDLLALNAKLFLSVVLSLRVGTRNLGTAKVAVVAYTVLAQRALGPFIRHLPPHDNIIWAVLCNLRYPEQERFARQLCREGFRAALVAPELRLVDVLRAWRASVSFLPRFFTRWGQLAERMYVGLTLMGLFQELLMERRRIERLIGTGCRLVLAQDDSDYLSVYRSTLLRERGITVVSVMHGMGFYGPHQGYSSYCLWGDYMRDRYKEVYDFPNEMLEVTGKPDLVGPVHHVPGERCEAVAVLLAPLAPRNRWGDICNTLTGLARVINRRGLRTRVLLKLHPGQGGRIIEKIVKLVEKLGVEFECISGTGLQKEWLEETGLCITAFSTAGFEAIAAGVPTLFFCAGSRVLVPIADSVPECHVRSAPEYEEALEKLLRDPSARYALLKKQQEAIVHLFADDAPRRIETFCRGLLNRLEMAPTEAPSQVGRGYPVVGGARG